MPPSTAYQKRVKRRVTARQHAGFAVTAPGLETLCAQELSRLSPTPTAIEPVSGGVAFQGHLTTLYLANLHLRTATRILMRLDRFKATRFDHILGRLAAFPWELFLFSDQPFAIHVSARRSRLYHRAAIAERARQALAERLAHHGVPVPGVPVAQRIYLRLDHDRATLSLDSSGDALYKRGYKTQGARAPLRETLAAAILIWGGYTPERPLVDPLCGGGTFSMEAALLGLGIAPGLRRHFAFEGWPAFRRPHWDYLREKACAKETRGFRSQIFASDQNASVCNALAAEVQGNGLGGVIQVDCQDFMALTPDKLPQLQPAAHKPAAPKGLVALNPPYGVRLGHRSEARGSIAAMGGLLRAHWKGWRLAILLPEADLARHFGPGLTPRRLRHGGLKLTLLTGQLR
jgi:putative N6-adenine-specific DNA methylase